MPTVLQLSFPGRRYHATPWGHHVNEGHVEWPPSPWRILRALLSTGFTKLGWDAATPPEEARRLIERLAERLPCYALPSAALAHSRHYVDAAGKKPLLIDAWAQVDDGLVEVVWPVDLPAPERRLLDALAAAWGYLGRAESWVTARVTDSAVSSPNCFPDEGGVPGPGFESVRVLCAVSADSYSTWRAARVTPILAQHEPPAGKKRTAAQQKKLDAALRYYPPDLIGALCVETSYLQAQGWSAAPGSREVTYWRRSNATSVIPPRQRGAAATRAHPLALLALSTGTGSTSALPAVTRVFPQGRLLHRAVASVIGHQMGGNADLALALLGRTTDGKAQHDHRHAHFLFLDLDDDQRLDHVLVHAPGGMRGPAVDALRRVRRTFMKGGAGELRVAFAGAGEADILRRIGGSVGASLARCLGPPGGATAWRSATPYVAPRMLKRSGRDSLAGLVRAESARRGLPAITEVRVVDVGGGQPRSMRHFVLHDQRHEPPRRVAFALEIEFEAPVVGPICLGYGAHAGLGRFEAAEPALGGRQGG